MTRILFGAVACLALFLTQARVIAQEAASTESKALTAIDIAKKMKDFLAADYVFDGSVSDQTPEGDDASGGMSIIVGGGAGAAPFQGKFEIVHAASGELAAVSRGATPRVAFIDDGVRRLFCTLSDGDEVGAARFANELSAILAPEDFAKVSAKVEWKATVGEKGDTTYKAEFPARFLRSVGGGGSMRDIMAPKVMGVSITLKFDAQANPVGLSAAVERSDPMAGIRQKAMSGEIGSGAVDPTELESADEAGVLTTYSVTKKNGKASKRTQQTLAFLRESTKSETE